MDATPKERPILFSSPMVRALLDGRKTQTRRIVKHELPPGRDEFFAWFGGDLRNAPNGCAPDGLWARGKSGITHVAASPFGVPGDRLWVRECFGLSDTDPGDGPDNATVFYRATDGDRHDLRYQRWRPAIHMPRWASRITLTITDVRVERVRDISDADVTAEGARDVPVNEEAVTRIRTVQQYRGKPELCNDMAFASRARFMVLWNSIHGSGAWDRNDWVFALTFTVEVRQ
jgi:hypothetical protein